MLILFLLLLVILSLLYPHNIINYPHFIDWRTIMALTGLLVITTGLKESGYFNFITKRMLKRFHDERTLSLFLVLFSALLSAFITNDITLFIVIPLTFSIQSVIKNDISKLIIFEAIAVNVGSALTPIGNPQNLYLWHRWNISFLYFIFKMSPLVIIQLVLLLIFIWIVFPREKIRNSNDKNVEKYKKPLLWSSIILMFVYIVSIELKLTYIVLIIIILFYFLTYRKILLKVDWLLILLFMIIFIDFHIVSNIPIISRIVRSVMESNSAGKVFSLSILTSQLISNVPASVFISKFTNNWFAISYGVNIGGNGLVIGSIANIIALRMSNSKNIWINFHKFSVPFLLVTSAIVYVLFFLV